MFSALQKSIQGELLTDYSSRVVYATDASAYRELPLGVAYPKNESDLVEIVKYCNDHNISIIPRTAGTSLAGQVVGNGLVVDVSKHFTRIIEINEKEKWVKVQPGVVLDELNKYLKPFGLFFGPETSTSNRCMIGGMVGNNSCGAHSLVYGSTRDHLLSVKMVLHDGSFALFEAISKQKFQEKANTDSVEGNIYKKTYELLRPEKVINEIRNNYPNPEIKRRNTGYALDLLVDSKVFNQDGGVFNFCKLLAGSEGTLGLFSEIKLNLVDVPPSQKQLICVHFKTLEESLEANLVALEHKPAAIELMDEAILKCTEGSKGLQPNRFFIEGKPGAILIIELAEHSEKQLIEKSKAIIAAFKAQGYGYHYPVVTGDDIAKVWNLRKAGLGVLSNMPGDAKPVSVIEDTAILPKNLPDYIRDFKVILKKHQLQCVFHAHIATGELHLRPVLNLKLEEDRKRFRQIAKEIAELVKKYRGSLSGEHGDGRLRGEFIETIIGTENSLLLKEVKKVWDPNNIFNPGKITDTPRMDESLRYKTPKQPVEQTMFRYAEGSYVQLAEKCNGSGDCRKTAVIGGTMCPSYQASLNEHETTRARANLLREYLTTSTKNNPFNHRELYQILDLCISCKACKSECPSGVDMAKLKAEFLYQYYQSHAVPLRTRFIGSIAKFNRIFSLFASFYNMLIKKRWFKRILENFFGISSKRTLPKVSGKTLYNEVSRTTTNNNNIEVYLFCDEFTNYNDTSLGLDTLMLLESLGYKVKLTKPLDSGRAYFSKGLLRKAKRQAEKNVRLLGELVSEKTPLIGIEPSAILSFRDEYPEIVNIQLEDKARQLSKHVYTIEEFLAREISNGRISVNRFTKESCKILYHGHCQQKSIASTKAALTILNFPENYSTTEIQSGCCGMAGSFGYEKEHYDFSMRIGELKLFPAVREASENTIIAASGTSCRNQIKDGTEKQALHPVQVLLKALT